MNAVCRAVVALLVTLGIAVGIARTAHAGDDDDDTHDGSGQSSVEFWPPTEINWPPLEVPDGDAAEPAPTVLPAP